MRIEEKCLIIFVKRFESRFLLFLYLWNFVINDEWLVVILFLKLSFIIIQIFIFNSNLVSTNYCAIFNNFIIPKILGHENCENFSSQNYENYFIKLLRNSFNSNLQISPLPIFSLNYNVGILKLQFNDNFIIKFFNSKSWKLFY